MFAEVALNLTTLPKNQREKKLPDLPGLLYFEHLVFADLTPDLTTFGNSRGYCSLVIADSTLNLTRIQDYSS